MRPTRLVRARSRLRRLLGDERGAASLSELIVVMAISTIVLTGLTSTFVSASHAQIDANNRFEAQQRTLLALSTLRRELHCASSVTQEGGAPLASGGAYQSIVLTLGSYCPTGSGSITWCTRSATSGYGLWRVSGAACGSSGGRLVADYLRLDHVFSLPTSAPTTSHLQTLHVDFPVSLNSGSTRGTYRLVDDLVLRNSVRQ